jgi:glutamate/tyrosine decarboxylase-like PLP-dependent enzyme
VSTGSVDWVPEFSRRARGFPIYAALRSLGRSGVAEIVERCCAGVRRFAEQLGADEGVEIVNDVVLNQVLVRIVDGPTTDAVGRLVRESGEAWMSGMQWGGRERAPDLGLELADDRRARDRAVAAIRQAVSTAARSVAT